MALYVNAELELTKQTEFNVKWPLWSLKVTYWSQCKGGEGLNNRPTVQ